MSESIDSYIRLVYDGYQNILEEELNDDVLTLHKRELFRIIGKNFTETIYIYDEIRIKTENLRSCVGILKSIITEYENKNGIHFYYLMSFKSKEDMEIIDVELPIFLQNFVSIYNTYTYLLCVVLTDKLLSPWFYKHFNNIYLFMSNYLGYGYTTDVNDFTNSLFYCERLGYDVAERIYNLNDVICKKLFDKNYVYIFVDYFFLPIANCYNKTHFVHEVLLYGVDELNREYKVLFFEAGSVLKQCSISKNVIIEAFIAGVDICKSDTSLKIQDDIFKSICFYKKKPFMNKYKMDIKDFCEDINDYLSSKKNLEKLYYSNLVYVEPACIWSGLVCGQALLHSLQKSCEGHEGKVKYQVFHLLYEHKKVFLEKIKFLLKIYSSKNLLKILDYYNKLVEKWDNIRMIAIKKIIKQENQRCINCDQPFLDKISKLIHDADKLDEKIMLQLKDELTIFINNES